MKLRFYFIVFFIPFVLSGQTANISGNINSYSKVNAVAAQSVDVGSAAGFVVNDRVLIIQMKGATINTVNSPSFGAITSYNDAGNYEFATVASISGTTITFVNPLIRTYTSSGFVQLVKVPAYNNVVVTGALTCNAWNGTTGGVLAFEASGTITLNANIDVSGKGFLGGALSNGAITGCAADTFDYFMAAGNLAGALKGEGIVNPNISMADGKGAWANGGGAGNDCNGGGAGGGNYGLGGHGGDPKVNVSCPPYFYQNSGGNSGKALQYSNAINKVFMGGGGGCGHQNDGTGTAGQVGGGIVILRGASLTGNNNYIKSNGVDNNLVAGIDGQGGGGAGGSVLLDVCSINTLNVSVIGGKGGIDNFNGSDCHGKGGGGGGGIVWVAPSTMMGVTTTLTGGMPGVFTYAACLCYNTSNGATQGGTGGTLTGLVIPGTTSASSPGNVTDTTVCTSGSVQLTASSSSSYSWSTGSVSQTINAGTSGTYWVQLSNGCSSRTDTFHVHINTPPSIDIIHDGSFCNIVSCVLNESSANASAYIWSTGATTSSISVTTTGIYWVDMVINQCSVRDSATIIILSTPTVSVANYTVCPGQTINIVPAIAGGSGTYLYNWGGGYTNSFYTTTPKADSVFSVAVTDANGCAASVATGSITVLGPLTVNVVGLTTCSFDTVRLLASVTGGSGVYSYTWSPSNSHQNPLAVIPANSTVYTVTVSDGCSVNVSDTANVLIVPAPNVVLPLNASGCAPVCINLLNIPYNTLSGWQWNYGNGTLSTAKDSIYCYTRSGSYNLSFSYTTTTGCSKTVTSNSIVTVFPMPGADFSASAFSTDIFDSHIQFYNTSTNYNSSHWAFGDLSTSSQQNPSHNYSTIGEYPVTLIVNNQYGCIDTVTKEVIITDIYTFYAPNTFSPNSDELNEFFLPTGTGWDIETFHMYIFDRWGNLVLTTRDAYKGWDGKIHGTLAQEDTYVWKVTLKDIFGEAHSYSGVVSLIK